MKLRQKSAIACFMLGLSLAGLLPTETVQAEEQRTLVVSAYYSPLPNQARYATGTYAGDIRLNGNGTNGADGTEVYQGMLAAPRTYEFGTQVYIPGLGVGTVHDRGGAINAYEDYDRIDVWMGWGDEGLQRALEWGKRKVVGTLYAPGAGLTDSLYFAEVTVTTTVAAAETSEFEAGLAKDDEGESVTKVQEALVALGYLSDASVTGVYDTTTMEAVYEMQKEAGLVSSWADYGAGYFGEKTRSILEDKLDGEDEITDTTSSSVAACANAFCSNLSSGDSGEEVTRLQEELQVLGYFDAEITGNYGDLTEAAVLAFQLDYGIVTSGLDVGAGVLGPKTRQILNTLLNGEVVTMVAGEESADEFFKVNLLPGDAGGEVRNLQQFLADKGYLDGEIGGYYGEVTEAAVLAFQAAEGLTESGEFDVETRARANEIIEAEGLGVVILQGVDTEEVPLEVLVGRITDASLSLGDAGDEVSNLQAILIKLEYLDGEVSGTYDSATEVAVLSFQLDAEVIVSVNDAGAGVVGPKTREALVQVI